jgi:TPP-dependent pyruvate/acetoin dehydrogenase alpha subunit
MKSQDELTSADLVAMYRWMVLTREFENRICSQWGKGGVVEVPHGSQGQEAVGVGVCYRLRPSDQVLPSLRTRAAFLVRGVSPRVQMAAVYAKGVGPGGGKSTAHHMGYPDKGILLGSAIIGASITVAVGAALAMRLRKRDDVVVCFFGDGAAQRGDFHEGLNLAGVFKLPILFILENNGYAEYTPVSKHMAAPDFACRAIGYGFEGLTIDGNDILAVHRAAQQAVARARSGSGPTLLECVTYRQRSHNEITPPNTCRDPLEVKRWMEKDPILAMRSYLVEHDLLDENTAQGIHAEAVAEIDEAVRYAEASPFPDTSDLCQAVYPPDDPRLVGGRRS